MYKSPKTFKESLTPAPSPPIVYNTPCGSYCPYRSLIGEWESKNTFIKFSPGSNGTTIDMFINGEPIETLTRFTCILGNAPGNLTVINGTKSFKITSTSKETFLNINGKLFTKYN